MAQNRAQDQLVEAIYQAATGERPWIDTVVSIANELGGIAGVLYDREVAGRLGRISLNASFGYSASAQTAFLSHYRSIDVRVPMALQWAAGRTYVDDRDIPFSAISDTELHTDFYLRNGVGHVTGMLLANHGSGLSILSIHRDIRLGPFTHEEVNLIDALGPHLARAWKVSCSLNRASQSQAASSLAIEYFQTAVFLVDSQARILRMSAAAEEVLRDASILCLRHGRLEAAFGGDNDALQIALRETSRSIVDVHGISDGIIRLRHRNGIGTTAIFNAPVPNDSALGGANVLVFVAGRPTELRRPILQAQFGFTPAEARVVASLVNGLSVGEVSDQYSITRETVRSHLKSAMSKAGVHSQVQLAALALRSLAVLREPRE